MIRPEPIQDPWELAQLVDLYLQLEPRRVLEIGTNNGGSLIFWAQFAAPFTTIVSVDLGERDQYKEFSPHFDSWLAPGASLHTIIGDSHNEETFLEIMAHGPYDFIFIDGDHSYAGVRSDWITANLAAAPRAVVAFHDIICERTPEDEVLYGPCDVHKLWAEIKSHRDYLTKEFIAGEKASYPTHENPEHLGIGVVYLL